MTRDDAVRQLQRVIGPLATTVVGSHRSGPRQRAAAKCEEQDLAAQLEVLREKLRRKIAARHEPRDLKLQRLIVRLERLRSEAHARAGYYRFWAGEDHGRFQIERAKADSWDELLALLNKED